MESPMTRTAVAIAVVAALSGCAALTPGEKSPRATTVPHERISHSAGDSAGQYALGKYYLGQRRHALALVAFTKALAADPDHIEARNGRAAALAQLGDLQAASAELEAAIQRAPGSAHLHGNLGYVRMLAGEHVAAAEALRRAFELDPQNARVRANWSALAAKVAENPVTAAGLAARLKGSTAGITPPAAPPVATPSAIREVVSASVMNLAYAPAPAGGATAIPASASTNVITITPATRSADAAPAVLTAPVTTALPATSPSLLGSPAMPESPSATGTPITIGVPPTPAATPEPAAAPAVTNFPKVAGVEPPRPPTQKAPLARIAVANGNGTPGIARRYGDALRSGSVQVVRISNAPRFDVSRSKILFRDGQLDAALALSRRLVNRPEIMLDNSISARVDVQLILGADAARTEPLAENHAGPSQVASVAGAR